MADTYSTYPRSLFPNSIDEFEYMQDITADLLTAVSAYNSYIRNGNLDAANQLLSTYPNLKKCLFNADKINQILDAVMTLETFFRDEIDDYITTFVVDRGTWSSSTTDYVKYNVVKDSNNVPYIALKDVLDTKALLTNSEYWVALGIRGEKGDKGDQGTSFEYKGAYSSSITYETFHAVTYDGRLYVSLSQNKGVLPTTTSSWILISELNYPIDDALSSTSTNPVQNKVITEALQNVNIAVDDAISETSTNPVQNKVVAEALKNVTIGEATTTTAGTVSTLSQSFAGQKRFTGGIYVDGASTILNGGLQVVSGGATVTGNVAVTGNITSTGTITGSKIYNAVFNDYAEWFPKEDLSEKFEPGDVISWGDCGVTKSQIANDPMIVGIYSDSYGHIVGGENLENMEDNHEKYVPVGLCGRLEVKVVGKVKRGDLIVSSPISGVGMVNNDAEWRIILGKAISDKDSEAKGLVTVLIK